MHILVTGGCGFIGSHVSARLVAEGHRVTILDDLSNGRRERAPAGAALVVDDIVRPGVFDPLLKGIDACIHLAAIASVQVSNEQRPRARQVNLGGTAALFDAIVCSNKPRPVVFASSAAIYGNCDQLPMKESAPCRPLSDYGADKLACEWQGRQAWEMHGVPNMGLRFFNVYGPGQSPDSPYSGVISIFIDRLRAGRPLTVYGDGEQTRDFIFVSDIVEGIVASLSQLGRQPGFAALNLCTGEGTSINTLAATLGSILGTFPIIERAPGLAGEARHSVGDPSQAQKLLGLQPARTLTQGLTQWLAP